MPATDPLLDELNGSLPPFASDADAAAQVPGPSRDSQLTVAAPQIPSRVGAADAVHSTAAGGAGYRVKVKGEYFAQNLDGKGKTKKPYEAEFNVTKLEGCLSVIKNKLLKLALKKKDPLFTADRTCYIIDTAPLSAATPKSNNLAYMDRGQLEQYVLTSAPRIPIDPSPANYPDVTHLREAIIDYVQNPGLEFVAREAERQAKRLEERELALLNPGLDVGA